MSRPYFEVGEEVMVCSPTRTKGNGPATVVAVTPPGPLARNPRGKGVMRASPETRYWLDTSMEDDKYSGWVRQSSLRKRHKPSTESYVDLIKLASPISTS